MEIRGTYVERRSVTIDVDSCGVFEQLRQLILKHRKLPEQPYIDSKGQLVMDVEYRGSHSWFEKKVIDPTPSEETIQVLNALAVVHREVLKATNPTNNLKD